ncbi:MAG: glycosyltransferase [Caldilineaceae bacterium]
MKLLFFTPQLPYPPHQGTTIRNFNLIRHLAANHKIDLVSFLAPGQRLTNENPLHQYCKRILTAPQPERRLAGRAWRALTDPLPDMALRLESAEMRAIVNELSMDYEIIQIEGIEMAQYGLQAAARSQSQSRSPRVLFDDHNCEYLLQKRNAVTDLQNPRRWVAGCYSVLQWWKLRHYEAAICRQADIVTAVSAPDQEALQKLVPGKRVAVIANGITPSDYSPRHLPSVHAPSAACNLLFTGKMDYRPNIDAALWFGSTVFPLIQQAEPQARFQIVGMNPHLRLDPLRTNSAIEITGAVESMAPYLSTALCGAIARGRAPLKSWKPWRRGCP